MPADSAVSRPETLCTPLTSVVANWSHHSAKAASRCVAASPQGVLTQGRRLADQPRIVVEDPLHQPRELVDAVVAHAVLHGRKQAELAAEAQDVPGIDQRAALDRPVQQVLDLRASARRPPASCPRSIAVWPVVRRPSISATIRGAGTGSTRACLPLASGMSHQREQVSQVDVLQVLGPQPGHAMVQMLPRAPNGCRRAVASARNRSPCGSGRCSQKLLIEPIAVAGDPRQERGQRDGGIVRLRPAAAHAGGHEHRAGQHGGRFVEQLAARNVAVLADAGQQGIERHLLHDEPAVATLVVDVVRVPLAEVIVGPLVDRVIEVVGPRVEGQLVQQLQIEVGLFQQTRRR